MDPNPYSPPDAPEGKSIGLGTITACTMLMFLGAGILLYAMYGVTIYAYIAYLSIRNTTLIWDTAIQFLLHAALMVPVALIGILLFHFPGRHLQRRMS